MEIEVMIPKAAVDFNFDSACSSPYISAPSSPQRFGNFVFSAPTSPTRSAFFFRSFDDPAAADHTVPSTIPFRWEEKPGVPKSTHKTTPNEDFAFEFTGQVERTSLSAEELFEGGVIRPLKPPPGSQFTSPLGSPRSPISKKTMFTTSPRSRNRSDPFQTAIDHARKGRDHHRSASSLPHSNSISRKGSRSLSPLRVSDLLFERENQSPQQKSLKPSNLNPKPSNSASKGYRKWRLKDFLLFRSASEGRETGKDPLLRKYYATLTKKNEDVKNSSFRSTESSGSGSVSRRRRSVSVSAHEVHYTVNRAVSEEMKRKTFLPYKAGLLGCLGFNSAVHQISRSIDSLTRG